MTSEIDLAKNHDMIFRAAEQDFILKNSDGLFKRMAVFAFTITVWWLSENRLRPLFGKFIQSLRNSLGNGAFVQNVLSQSLPVVIVCLVLFLLFRKAKIIPSIKFKANAGLICKEGFLWGLLICVPTIPLAIHLGFHFGFNLNWQNILGNIISNFYEEFVYRVFLFSVSAYAFRRIWVGIVISAILFAIVHNQYPLSMQIIVALASIFFALAYVRSRSIFSALVAHQISDMILDTILLQ